MRTLLRTALAIAALALLSPSPLYASARASSAGAPVYAVDLSASPFTPGTPSVDGLSDQSLPYWDGAFAASPFARGFRFARYVVQWNVLSGAYPNYLSQLEAWFDDVLASGLTPEISLASYDGVLPQSEAEYRTALQALLERFPAIAYLEAWDEPNHTPGLPADTAAHYTLLAQALCREHGCTVIAGNLLDTPDMVSYERRYERALGPASLIDWGIHPYLAVKSHSLAGVLAFRSNLPHAGAGERIWFTEIGAYMCEGGTHPQRFGERSQALDAAWLVHRLMPAIVPAHAFYYELLFRDHRPPPCDRTDSDTALYAPTGAGGADAPRAAASYIYDDRASTPLEALGDSAVASASG